MSTLYRKHLHPAKPCHSKRSVESRLSEKPKQKSKTKHGKPKKVDNPAMIINSTRNDRKKDPFNETNNSLGFDKT